MNIQSELRKLLVTVQYWMQGRANQLGMEFDPFVEITLTLDDDHHHQVSHGGYLLHGLSRNALNHTTYGPAKAMKARLKLLETHQPSPPLVSVNKGYAIQYTENLSDSSILTIIIAVGGVPSRQARLLANTIRMFMSRGDTPFFTR